MSEVPQRADVLVSDPWFCFTSRVQGLGSMVEGVGFRIVVTATDKFAAPAAPPAPQANSLFGLPTSAPTSS